MGATVGQTT